MRSDVLRTFVGSQGDHKAVTNFMSSYDTSKQSPDSPGEAGESLLSDFRGGFKGLG